jgi:alpha-glucosidase
VAPVIEEGATERSVLVPPGEWIHVWSGHRYGRGRVAVAAPIGEPPVFYRAGSAFAQLFETLPAAREAAR